MGGYEMLVHGEVFRGRYRKSYENSEPFVPDKIEHVKFDIGDVAHTFKKDIALWCRSKAAGFRYRIATRRNL